MAKRRRRRKISKLRLFYRLLIVIHLSLLLSLGYGKICEYIGNQPAVKRAGIKYMIKGWLSQWDWHWIIR